MIYLDVHIESVLQGKKIRLRPLPGADGGLQRCKTDTGLTLPVPRHWVAGNRKIRSQYPVGTVFIADLMLVSPDVYGNYLKVRTGHSLEFPFMQRVKMSRNGQLRIF